MHKDDLLQLEDYYYDDDEQYPNPVTINAAQQENDRSPQQITSHSHSNMKRQLQEEQIKQLYKSKSANKMQRKH